MPNPPYLLGCPKCGYGLEAHAGHPELAAALDRIAALAETGWVTEALSGAAIAGALLAEVRRKAADFVEYANSCIALATRGCDPIAVQIATANARVSERVLGSLALAPPPHVEGATEVAAAELDAALGTTPWDPQLIGTQPICQAAEAALVERLDIWRRERVGVADAVLRWFEPDQQSDTLAALERAVDLLRRIDGVARRGAVIVDQLHVARAEGGSA